MLITKQVAAEEYVTERIGAGQLESTELQDKSYSLHAPQAKELAAVAEPAAPRHRRDRCGRAARRRTARDDQDGHR